MLIVVESPNKVNKIQKYLGSKYEVIATKGHFRDLPKNHQGIIPEKWTIIRGKNDVAKRLKRLYKKHNGKIILATDPDREGEAIAWHVCDYLGIPADETPRALFNEVTEIAVKNAIDKSLSSGGNKVDMKLVNAQRARRLIDRRLGYSGTRYLWKTIGGGVSAGRCLIPAAKLLCDINDKEDKSATVYIIKGEMNTSHGVIKLNIHSDTPISCSGYLDLIDTSSVNNRMEVMSCNECIITKQSPKPLDTSSAITAIGGNPTRVMNILQKLFEKGLITYHRTTSKTLSHDFIRKIHPDKTNNSVITDGAHEAIRPCDPAITPEGLYFEEEDSRLLKNAYQTIWEHSIGSLYPDWKGKRFTAVLRNGWKITWDKSTYSNDKTSNWLGAIGKDISSEYDIHQTTISEGGFVEIQDGWITRCRSTCGRGVTETGMVRLLEKSGIGRPSTYATIINHLSKRGIAGYVNKQRVIEERVDINPDMTYTICVCKEKEGILLDKSDTNITKSFRITDVGRKCITALDSSKFDEFFNVSYTSHMEDILDKISSDDSYDWTDFVANVDSSINKVEYTYTDEPKKGSFPDTILGEINGWKYGKGRTRYGPVIWKENMSGPIIKGYRKRQYKKVSAKYWHTITLESVMKQL